MQGLRVYRGGKSGVRVFFEVKTVVLGGSEPQQGETVDFFLQLTWRGLKVCPKWSL